MAHTPGHPHEHTTGSADASGRAPTPSHDHTPGHTHGRVPVAEHAAAVAELVAGLGPIRTERLTLADALARPERRRVLAADVVAPTDLPRFDDSQMDGYAVRAADLAGATPDAVRTLPVAFEVAAGSAPRTLPEGATAAIMTGAPVPDGADAVVPVEAVVGGAFRDDAVSFTASPKTGTFVRRRGSDLAAGAVLLPAGTELGPAQWGALAAADVTAVEVVAPTRVLVVSTGHEIRGPEGALEPGQIRDANGVSLALALADAGAEVTTERVTTDDPDALLAALARHPATELVVTTGGVSAGTHEVVKLALGPLGVRFTSVAMQPGGPQGVGTAALPHGDVPVVAFPGNPVSTLVSTELFLRAPLRARHGLHPAERPRWRAPLAESVESPPLHQLRRGAIDAAGMVTLVGGPSSHLVAHYARAEVLVHLPPDVTSLAAGATVEVQSIGQPIAHPTGRNA